MISSIDVDGIGRLWHKGVSKSWTGEIHLAGESRPVPLTIRGTPEGPTPRQVAAVRAMVASSAGLKTNATVAAGLARLLAVVGLEAQDVWDVFEVSDVDVPEESYDPAAIHVVITLEHVEHRDDFCPAIDVCEGKVVDVLSGT